MANCDHLKILQGGVGKWNQWRQENKERADLRGSDLSDANLEGIDFRATELEGARLRNARLAGALFGAGAFFVYEGKRLMHIGPTDFDHVDFTGASLLGAVFRWVRFTQATLDAAIVGATVFAYADLSKAVGLDTVKHCGPSTIGIDTLYLSGGRIPENFLRGAGVPDNLIVYSASLAGQPSQSCSCFISYSTKDEDFAERLFANLQARGVRCWFAPNALEGGKKLHDQISQAIRLHDRLLLVLSEDSMSSEWVKTEISSARKREVEEGRRVLFPIRLVNFDAIRDWEWLDADTGKDSAREIREYFIPDFSNWKDHDSLPEIGGRAQAVACRLNSSAPIRWPRSPAAGWPLRHRRWRTRRSGPDRG